MCKLFILSNTAKLKPIQLSKLLKASASIMGKTDSHGFGWTMLNSNKFVGERCLDPEYFENRFFNNGTVPSMFKPIFEAWEANAFGKLPTQGFYSGGLLVHARISTNQISLENTHPFVNDTYALIHNGIVDNVGGEYQAKSTCDSEHALQHLTTGGIDGMVQGISGYYAIGALNKVTGELLVVKDSIANLNACYVPALESMAFGTNGDQLHAILKAAELAHTKIKAVKDNVAFTFNRKGELVSTVEIKPVEKVNDFNQRDYYSSMGWNYRDTDYSEGSSNVVAIRGEASVIPSDIQRLRDLEDGKIDDGAPDTRRFYSEPEFDFMFDDSGERIPNYILDKLYVITDADNKVIDAQEFAMMDDVEASYCDVIERASGESVGRRAS